MDEVYECDDGDDNDKIDSEQLVDLKLIGSYVAMHCVANCSQMR